MGFGIEGVGYFFPGPALDVEPWARRRGLPAAKVAPVLAAGARFFHEAGPLGEVELAAAALDRLLAQGLRPAEIDVVLHAHTQPFSVPPAPESLPLAVCRRFGLQPRLAFSVTHLACVSLVAALALARTLFATRDDVRQVVVLTADRCYVERFRLRVGGVLSDGAAATWLRRDCRRNRLGGLALLADGALYRGTDLSPETLLAMMLVERRHTLAVLERALTEAGHAAGDYQVLVTTNSDGPEWEALGRELTGRAGWAFRGNLARRGHACCSDLPVNLADGAFLDLRAGQRIACACQSNVGAYGAFTLEPAQEALPCA